MLFFLMYNSMLYNIYYTRQFDDLELHVRLTKLNEGNMYIFYRIVMV
jgi:hypothetical protein